MKNILNKEWLNIKSSLLPVIFILLITIASSFMIIYKITEISSKNITFNIVLFFIVFYFIYFYFTMPLLRDFSSYIQLPLFSLPIKRKNFLTGKYILFLLEFFICTIFIILISNILGILFNIEFYIYPFMIIGSFLYNIVCVTCILTPTIAFPVGTATTTISIVSSIFIIIPMLFLSKILKSIIYFISLISFNNLILISILLCIIVFLASLVININFLNKKDF